MNDDTRKMSSWASIAIIAALILVVGGFMWYVMSGEGGDDVRIDERFDTKIVYTTDQDVDVAALEAHCAAEGGTFNECGTICEPGADFCAQVCAYTCEFDEADGGTVDTSSWQTFTSAEYDFSLRYPADDWNSELAPDDEIAPKFNFYIKPQGVPVNAPFDHFANVTNVSVYPEGIPTEGLSGETQRIDWGMPQILADRSRVWVLEDGTPFAAYIQFVNAPDSWTEPGYAWVRLRIDDYETTCLSGGVEVSENACDPLTGDTIVHSGNVDESLWPILKEVVASMTFSQGDQSPTATMTPNPSPTLSASYTGDAEDLITLDEPQAGATVSSPLTVSGEARGQFYFEAQFTAVLVDWDGRIIAEEPVTAQGDWMTTNFVPFEATIDYEVDTSVSNRGALILQKANPSGLPENDGAVEIPIFFAE